MQPLLLLANKYEVKAPLSLVQRFLRKHFTTAKYTSLPQAQLARLPAWLAIARRLQMSQLHASIMACLEDNLTKLSAPDSSASLTSTKCKNCKKMGWGIRYVDSTGQCPTCRLMDPLAGPAAAVTIFQSIWGVTADRGSSQTSTKAIKEQLAALQQCLDLQEAMQLLMALVAKDYKGP